MLASGLQADLHRHVRIDEPLMPTRSWLPSAIIDALEDIVKSAQDLADEPSRTKALRLAEALRTLQHQLARSQAVARWRGRAW